MNIKSLLTGSALAAFSAAGAQAADAIFVANPEPMEYVRVCDVYGAGFFYIPGTETCLRIGGYVRFQTDFGEKDDGWRHMVRAAPYIDARSETELGTLGGFIELRGDVRSGHVGSPDADNWLRVQKAIISLGGLSLGLSDTLYDAGLSGEFDSGGGDRVHFVRYTFDAANGIYASLSLEEADDNKDYTPNVVANLGMAQGWGSLNLWGAYDATAEEWAAKVIAAIKATDAISVELLGIYESGKSFYSVSNGKIAGVSVDGYTWSGGGLVKYAFTPKLSLGLGGQYFADRAGSGNNDWAAGAVVDYTVVENLDTKLAVNYRDGDSYEAAGKAGGFSGFLRIDRKF